MTQTKINSLENKTREFCSSSIPVFIVAESTKSLLREILEAILCEPERKAEYMGLIEQIRIKCDCSQRLMSATLASIGMEKYKADRPSLTEIIFRLAVEIYPEISVQNNLAYVCRRHKETLRSSDVEIIDLLIDGTRCRDTFCMVNMALHFAWNLGREDDWQLADSMFHLMESKDSSFADAFEWWYDLAMESDDEGLLVLLWMERHGNYVLPQNLREHVSGLYERHKEIPDWILEKYQEIE